MKNPHYQLRGTPGQCHYVLIGARETILGISENFTSKQNCLNGIESSRVNSQSLCNFEQRSSRDSRFYFVLKAQNGEILITSPMYDTAPKRNRAMKAYVFFGDVQETIDLIKPN